EGVRSNPVRRCIPATLRLKLRSRYLLADSGNRELAIAHALRQPFGKARHRFFAIGGDEFLEGREQGGIGQAIAVDAVEDRFFPTLEKIVERRSAGILEFVPDLEGCQTILHDSHHAAALAEACRTIPCLPAGHSAGPSNVNRMVKILRTLWTSPRVE